MTNRRRLFSTLFLLLSAAASLLAQEAPKTPGQCVAGVDLEVTFAQIAGEREVREPDYAKALQAASDCIQRHPTYAPAWAEAG